MFRKGSGFRFRFRTLETVTKTPKHIGTIGSSDVFRVSVTIPDYFEIGTITEHATKY
jgi:hypothetical protein